MPEVPSGADVTGVSLNEQLPSQQQSLLMAVAAGSLTLATSYLKHSQNAKLNHHLAVVQSK